MSEMLYNVTQSFLGQNALCKSHCFDLQLLTDTHKEAEPKRLGTLLRKKMQKQEQPEAPWAHHSVPRYLLHLAV